MGKKCQLQSARAVEPVGSAGGLVRSHSQRAGSFCWIALSVLGFSFPASGAVKSGGAPIGGSSISQSGGSSGVLDASGTYTSDCQPWRYGDVTNDGTLDLDDILNVLDGFAGKYTDSPMEFVDIAPCGGGDGVINIDDVSAALEAFAGNPFCDDSCVPCTNNQRPVVLAGGDVAAEVGDELSFSPTFAGDVDGMVVGYEWDFGDGTRRSGRSVSHAYSFAGVYLVRLTVTDSCNDLASDVLIVTVTEQMCGDGNALPVASAGADRSAAVGVTVLFSGAGSSDSGGAVVEYWWSFGDGFSTGWQSSALAQHAYATGGSYTASLWVRDNCGDTSAADTLAVGITDGQTDELNPTILGFVSGNVGFVYGVAMFGDRFFAASQDLGVIEIDVSDPYSPLIERYSHSLAGVQGAAVSESWILTGGASNVARVAARADFGTPEESWASLGFVAQGMALHGDLACVAAGGSGLKVVDLSGSTPEVRATLSMFARDVAMSSDGRWAFVAAGGGTNGGLKVVSLTGALLGVPPTVVSSLPVAGSGNAGDIVLSESGDIAYLAESSGGLGVIDVSNPALPRRLASVTIPSGAPDSVAISGDLVLVATVNGAPRVHVFDAFNPASLEELGSTPGLYVDLVANDRFLFGAAANSGIRIVDLSDPWNPTVVSSIGSGTSLRSSCASNGEVALVGGNTGRITVLDVADPSFPVPVSEIGTVGQDLVMKGDLAYVASGSSGMQIFDLRLPSLPVALSTVPMFARGIAVSADGRWAFVAAGKVGGYGLVNVVDVSDPINPELVAGVATGANGIASDIAINESNTLAFVADFGTGLQIVDISDRYQPVLVGQGFATGHPAQQVTSTGDLVLVAAFGNGSMLHAVDVSNPAAPYELGSRPLFVQGTMEVYGDYALVPAGVFGLQVLDLTNPALMEIVTEVEAPGPAYSVSYFNDMAYVGDGTVVLTVVDLLGD